MGMYETETFYAFQSKESRIGVSCSLRAASKRDIDCRKRKVEGCEVESRGHTSVQVSSGPYLR